MEFEFFRRLTEPARAKAARARLRAQLEAAMACAALVASADGQGGLAPRLMLDQILDGVDSLRGDDPHVAVAVFEDFAAALRDNPADGRGRALSAIGAFAGAPDTSRLLMHIARAMAGLRGEVSAAAQAEIASIAKALALPGDPAAQERPQERGRKPAAEGRAAGLPAAPDRTGTVQTRAGSRPMGPPVIALGNEKGGTGKSTTAMHLAVALQARGHSVGTIDLDGHQGTLSRYIENRTRAAAVHAGALRVPRHRRIGPSSLRDREAAHAEESAALEMSLQALAASDFVVLDTPGAHSNLSRLGHRHANILITPLNDSFLDLDVLAQVDRERREVVEPSAYGRMVLDENARRAETGRPALDWIVMRNRLAHIEARNTRDMDALLDLLGARMGFRLHGGIGERVAYRELFHRGLTLLDTPLGAAAAKPGPGSARGQATASSSWRHARREIEDLVAALGLPDISERKTA